MLITAGKTESLLHGLLAFFKHLFADFSIDLDSLSGDEFNHWRQFFKELLDTCLKISHECSSILGNNGIIEGEEGGVMKVDCPG